MRDRVKKERKRSIGLGWVTLGLLLSALATVIYMNCYRLFKTDAQITQPENPLETQDTADMLVQQTYVLYHDLQQRQSQEPMDYLKLYVKPKPGCDWVLDESIMETYFDFSDNGMPNSELLHQLPISADCGSVYHFLRYLKKDYFVELEDQFARQIAYSFDYFCKDMDTGFCFSNTGRDEIIPESQYFYLVLVFDEYGNCEVRETKLGQDDMLMRKYVNVAARTVGLEARAYQTISDEANVSLDTYFTLGKPVNCEIIYGISKADWRKYESGEAQIYINNQSYDIGIGSHFVYWVKRMEKVLGTLLLLTCALAIFLPVNKNAAFLVIRKNGIEGQERPVTRWLRLPLEVLAAVGCLGMYWGVALCIGIVVATLNGAAAQGLAELSGMAPGSYKVQLTVRGINFLVLLLLFFFAWYIGVNLRDARLLKIRRFVCERSLICRFFPYMHSRVEKLYDTLCHFDLTQKSNKMILRVVVINGIILCLISALWLGGWGFAVVYSILLYLFLRKYVSDLQKKYGMLLKATNEIAEGNLNVQIQEDLGVFEPFRPQIYRIQEGFRRAVDEEVKSQRMKAELITNVSHDLKTPLTAIITYVNLLKEGNATEEQRREYLDTLERKSLRLKALIEDLFEVSKANSQSMTLNLMDVDVMNLVKQVAFEMGDKLTEHGLDLRLALPEEKVVLRLDSQRTYRIYENLFGNIAKYAMPGTRVYVNGFQVEDTVVITLKNIAAEEISVKPEELTERFVRGDAARNTEGSGLGLAIAKSFTELQNGTLEIEVDGDLFKVTTVWKK